MTKNPQNRNDRLVSIYGSISAFLRKKKASAGPLTGG